MQSTFWPITGGLRNLANMQRLVDEMAEFYGKFEKSFNDYTVELMDVRNVTVGALAEATGLSDHTIKNMRNKSDIMFPIQEIVAVCIVLHLPPETVPLVLFILCKEVVQLLQETFRDRRESLISVPCYIQRSFKRGLQGAEHKAAPWSPRPIS